VNQYVDPVSGHVPQSDADVQNVRTLSDADVAAVHEIVAAATEADGVTPLHEPALLQVTTESAEAVTHLLARSDGRLVGYAQLDQRAPASSHLECVVAPDARRQGWGRALVERARAMVAPKPLELWSHGDRPAAAALAKRLGFTRVRELWLMRRDLDADLPAVPPIESPLHLRTFRPGADEEAWLALNARAFADHPEQGRTTRADLDRRIEQSWFDPSGFFLVERDGDLVGFHWTKVHAADPPVGEVYVVGVDPDAQGLGLGRTLTLVGLHYLRDRGLHSVVLYVDATNTPAVSVYRKLGFAHTDTDVMYRS
jgi:mycothiol synthase